MTDKAEDAALTRLEESFPPLVATPILDHGTECVMLQQVVLEEYLWRMKRHFYRGGLAAVRPSDGHTE